MEAIRIDRVSGIGMRRITHTHTPQSFCYHHEGGRMGQRRDAELEVKRLGFYSLPYYYSTAT